MKRSKVIDKLIDLISQHPKAIICRRCQVWYIPSATSDPELCGNCSATKVA